VGASPCLSSTPICPDLYRCPTDLALSMARTPPPNPPSNHSTDDESTVDDDTTVNDDTTTDPTAVEEPVLDLVHPKLADAWKVHPRHQMCYIFEAVTPGRQWKRGTVYTEEVPFAEYGPAPWPDLTETDDLNTLKPYFPRPFP
jgi:hypothetical protein